MRIACCARSAALTFLACALTLSAQGFKVGAGKAAVQIPESAYPIDGFTAQHDPMMTRVLLLDDGSRRTAILVVDQTSIGGQSLSAMKGLLQKVAAVEPENAIVCASHTFSAPHVFMGPPPGAAAGTTPQPNPETAHAALLEHAIEAAVESAATQSVNELQPARIGFGTGTSMVNVNRDVPTPQGWWLGSNDSGYADHSLSVIRFDSNEGKPLALIVNLSVQSSIMDHSVDEKGNKLVTSDLAGAAMHDIEEHYGSNTVALFLIGASGDQEPYLKANRHVINADGSSSLVDIHNAGFTLVNLLGERLGQDALAVTESIQTSAIKPVLAVVRGNVDVPTVLGRRSMPTGPVTSYEYQAGPSTQIPVVYFRIGDMEIVGLQAELAAGVGSQIKNASPFPHTIVATMVDGLAKYMPDSSSYDRFTYEARNTGYGKGAAEAAASQIEKQLKQLRNTPARR